MGGCSSKSGNAGASKGGPTGEYNASNANKGGADLSPASSKGGGGGDLRYNMLKASKGDSFHETYEVKASVLLLHQLVVVCLYLARPYVSLLQKLKLPLCVGW